jgi:hypothetical protein
VVLEDGYDRQKPEGLDILPLSSAFKKVFTPGIYSRNLDLSLRQVNKFITTILVQCFINNMQTSVSTNAECAGSRMFMFLSLWAFL